MPEDDEDPESGDADEEIEDSISEPELEEDGKDETSSKVKVIRKLEKVVENGVTLYKCPYPGCNHKSKRAAAGWGHIRFNHLIKGERLDANGNLIKGTPTSMVPKDFPSVVEKRKIFPVLSNSERPRKVEHTAENDEETENADSGRKAEVKGRLRQLLKAVSASDPEQRDALMPTREVLLDYIKILAKARVSDEELDKIENAYEDSLRPDVETVLGKNAVVKFTSPPQAATNLPTLSSVARIAKMRGIVKQYISTLAKLPPSKRDELSSERETLLMLTKRLAVKEVPEQELTEMEDILEGEVRPAVDSAVSATQRAPAPRKENTAEDMMGLNLQQRKEELDMARMDRMLAEENMRHKQTLDAMRTSSGGGGGMMVPVVRPTMDEKGNIVKDADGKPVMETSYAPVEQAGSMNNMMMTMMLSGKLGGGDGAMAAILPAILDNNTKVLVAMLSSNKNDNGPSNKEILLEMQNKNLEMMMKMQTENKGKGDDPVLVQMREDLRATREAQTATQNQMHAQQLGYMKQELDDLKRYAYRDDFESVLKQKARLEELGLVTSNQKDADTKALEESRKALDKAAEKFDGVRADTKELFGPLVEAQAQVIKNQAQTQGLRRPMQPTYSEEQKKKVYKQMLENIEQGDEGEGEQGEEG